MPCADDSRKALLGHDRAGTVLRRSKLGFAYQPFGYQAVPGTAGLLGYTGQRREPRGGYQLGNGRRLYQPATMRFCQPDALSPFGRGGLNAYAYCGAEPVNRRDPNGMFYNLIPNLLGEITGGVFLTSVFNRTAKTIVEVSTNPAVALPGALARFESVGTAWGASLTVAGNAVGMSRGGASTLADPSVIMGMTSAAVYSASGAGPAAAASTWVTKARQAGISPLRVALSTVDELSGARLLTRRGFPRIVRDHDIELGTVGAYRRRISQPLEEPDVITSAVVPDP